VLPQSQNQNISCPPPAALTPIGSCEYYTLAYDHCYPIIPPTNFPFGYRFNYVPVMGEWSLQVFSNSSLNGTLASWELIVQWDMTPFMYYGGDYLVALVLFFVVSSAFLFVKKRSQFLWFTSLPCLAFHLAYFTLVLFVFGDFLALVLVMFQLSYNAICVPVLFLKIRGRLQGHVPRPPLLWRPSAVPGAPSQHHLSRTLRQRAGL